MSKNQFTREEFHKLVWSKPLKKLAVDLDLKEAIIKKICKEYAIPLPKSGHWVKLDFNKDVIIEKLSTNENWKGKLIDIEKYRSDFMQGHHVKVFKRKKEIESQFPKQSIVPRKLVQPCALVQSAKVYLDKKKTSRGKTYNDLIDTTSEHLAISVTKKNIPRILRFIDSFIKLLEKRGHQIEISSCDTIVIFNEERFKIRFREMCSRKVNKQRSWPSSELIPNGVLSVKMAFRCSTVEWKDGSKTLEQQLTKIIASLELRADKEKLERAEREKYWAEQKKLQAIRDQQLLLLQKENRRIEMLLDHASKWKVAHDLGLFIARIESSHSEKEISSGVQDWLKWARSVERSLSPVSGNIEKFVAQYKGETD